MTDGININEELLSDLTSRYAKEYGSLPNTHKQAIQYAYLCGRTDQKHEDLDTQIILTKSEIKILQTSIIKKILAAIESEYDLNYGEILLNPKEFYDLVEEFI